MEDYGEHYSERIISSNKSSMLKSISSMDYTVLSIVVFTHDYYVLGLPTEEELSDRQDGEEIIQFFDDFLEYKSLKDFRGDKILMAPVIRLFGYNSYSQKCCLHCHGVIKIY